MTHTWYKPKDAPEAYVYEWTNTTNGMKYIGCHQGKINTYIGSGVAFREAYDANPEHFKRTILARGDYEDMIHLEYELLVENDVKNNPMYYNNIQHKPGTHSHEVNQQRADKLRGVPKGPWSEERKAAGSKRTREWRASLSEERKAEIQAKITDSLTGMTKGPYTKHTCPHCGKTGGGGNMKRYHFDNCKSLKS